jgi:hypothetical protein
MKPMFKIKRIKPHLYKKAGPPERMPSPKPKNKLHLIRDLGLLTMKNKQAEDTVGATWTLLYMVAGLGLLGWIMATVFLIGWVLQRTCTS